MEICKHHKLGLPLYLLESWLLNTAILTLPKVSAKFHKLKAQMPSLQLPASSPRVPDYPHFWLIHYKLGYSHDLFRFHNSLGWFPKFRKAPHLLQFYYEKCKYIRSGRVLNGVSVSPPCGFRTHHLYGIPMCSPSRKPIGASSVDIL